MKTFHAINQNNKLQHLAANNLYNNAEQLIFDAKTGAHIGYLTPGGNMQPANQAPLIAEDPQLSLFDPTQLKLF